MALTGRDRTRYARHLLLPQLGEAGQERLLAAEPLRPQGDADRGALAVARGYLARAGVRVLQPSTDAVGTSPVQDALDARLPSTFQVASAEQIEASAGGAPLREAARALAGALAAVRTIQILAGLSDATAGLSTFAISSEEA